MGAGSIAVMFWGVPLPDDRADIGYGLAERYDGVGFAGATKLPSDTPPPTRVTSWPGEPNAGRHWIGVAVSRFSALPKSMRGRVIRASEAAQEVDLPSPETPIAQAKAAWAHFADWCTRRGWTPPEPGLYVVADYD